ncbi:MFS transporter [Nocardia sp. NPDC004123]
MYRTYPDTERIVISPDGRRAALAGALGSVVELYDFLTYGLAAASVFGKLFFPAAAPWVGVLLSFATFGAGFVARVFGAAVLGNLGDRLGRKPVLLLSVGVGGLATVAIGVLPTYAAIGVLAPLTLVLLRVVQGFFVGGEVGGGILVAVEHAPPGRRGWYGSWIITALVGGSVLAVLASLLAHTVAGTSFITWGWRLPFLISAVPTVVTLLVRAGLPETPEFEIQRDKDDLVRWPWLRVWRTAWRRIATVAAVNTGLTMMTFTLITFVLSYGSNTLHIAQPVLQHATLLAQILLLPSALLFGCSSDRYGALRIMLGGAIFNTLVAFPLFWLLDTMQPLLLTLAICIAQTGTGAMLGPLAAAFTEAFDVRVRYSGLSLGYQIGAVLGGGLVPLVGTALVHWSGGASWPVALYLSVGGLISVIGVLAMRNARRVS